MQEIKQIYENMKNKNLLKNSNGSLKPSFYSSSPERKDEVYQNKGKVGPTYYRQVY